MVPFRAVFLIAAMIATGACARPVTFPVVDPATVADASITAAVKTALLNDSRIDATEVTVATQAGVVTLGGSQPSREAAAEVVSIVRSVEGVRDVQSNIRVEAADAADSDAHRQ